MWVLRADTTESFEELLKHVVYRNTFEPLGPAGQRIVSLQTSITCLGDNSSSNLALFSRRLSIDETIHPVHIELKGDASLFVTEHTLNEGIYPFQNLSIYAEILSKTQGTVDGKARHLQLTTTVLADITDCSVGTLPEFGPGEQLLVPDENLDINNLDKVPTQTGLIFSGTSLIEWSTGRRSRGSNLVLGDIAY
jgi:hypothetical protein